MKTLSVLVIMVVTFTLGASTLCAQRYVYVNDNVSPQNGTRAFLVGKGGTLTPINGWATGGGGNSGVDLKNHTIALAQPIGQTCLYASNGGGGFLDTVAAFTISLLDGPITPVAGSPFSTGATFPMSIGLALGRNDLLFAASGGISVLGINADCSLNLLQNYPELIAPHLKVTPNGQFLITSDTVKVHSFSIDYATGQLTEVSSSQAQGSPQGIAIS
jgi:hypothetical protein